MTNQSVMQSVVEGKVTISDKIRALAAVGASRSEIADFLGRSYQHVRQVLVEDERRRGARPRSVLPGKAKSEPPRPAEQPEGASGSPFRLTVDCDGRLLLPAQALGQIGIRPGEVAVGRLQDGELIVSSAESAMHRARALVRSIVPPGVSLADELLADRRSEACE